MTNFERLKGINDSREFWCRITNMTRHPLSAYIDYPKYLDSESPNIRDALKVIATGRIMPSKAEINAAKNSAALQNKAWDEEVFVAQHTNKVDILEDGLTMMVAYRGDDNAPYLKVPAETVVDIVYLDSEDARKE